jgi:hypothetical protein
MQWRTEIEKIKSELNISYQTKLLTLGSCFSDTIGNKFLEAKFPVVINPFGTLFNPLSIARLFSHELFKREHIVKSNDVYYHLDMHSSICSSNKEDLVSQIQCYQEDFKRNLQQTDVVFITLGTAFVFEYLETEQSISNCHKLPSSKFSKRLLTLTEIVESFQEIVTQFPEKEFIFTVSPVRHTREGLSENMLSKSLLRVACGVLSQAKNIDYFPSYEMMLDDLRDYRFYTEDLIHINSQGQAYIWDVLQQTYFTEDTKTVVDQVNKVIKNVNHRPFNTHTPSYKTFLEKTLIDLESLTVNLDFSKEINNVKNLLNSVTIME